MQRNEFHEINQLFSGRLDDAIWWGVFSAIDQWNSPHAPFPSYLYRPTDQQLVEHITKGNGFDIRLLAAFAGAYGVLDRRLKRRDHLRERLAALSGALHDAYSSPNEPTPEQLGAMWFTAIKRVSDAIEPFGEPLRLKSLCMKALWFYHPERATMWDSRAVRGLNRVAKSSHNSDLNTGEDAAGFLGDFELLFNQYEEEINSAINIAHEVTKTPPYPYPRRVLDKALWLLGAEDNAEAWQKTINDAREILLSDPAISAASHQRLSALKC